MLDVRGQMKNIDGSVESSYRLYACQSYVIYSRPQSSDGKIVLNPLMSGLRLTHSFPTSTWVLFLLRCFFVLEIDLCYYCYDS